MPRRLHDTHEGPSGQFHLDFSDASLAPHWLCSPGWGRTRSRGPFSKGLERQGLARGSHSPAVAMVAAVLGTWTTLIANGNGPSGWEIRGSGSQWGPRGAPECKRGGRNCLWWTLLSPHGPFQRSRSSICLPRLPGGPLRPGPVASPPRSHSRVCAFAPHLSMEHLLCGGLSRANMVDRSEEEEGRGQPC